MIQFCPVKQQPYVDVTGHRRYLACLPAKTSTEVSIRKFGGGQTWRDKMPMVPQAQWEEFDDGQLVPIRDQLQHSGCTGSIAIGLAFARALAGAPVVELSGAYVYSWINGGRDQGATIDDAVQAIKDHGACLLSTVDENHIYRNQAAAGDAEAERFRAADAIPIASLEEAVSAELLRWTLYFGIDIGRNFNPDPSGMLPERSGSGGGHALYSAGGLRLRNRRPYFRVPNSWGEGWGVGGVCWMPASYLDFSQYGLMYALRPGADVIDDPQDDTVPPVVLSP